jgi:hypothetical protein
MSTKNSSDTIGNRTCDLPAYSSHPNNQYIYKCMRIANVCLSLTVDYMYIMLAYIYVIISYKELENNLM